MNAVELKTDLHHMIDKINDVQILNAVKVLLTRRSKQTRDWWDTLTETAKDELEESMAQADRGEVISHKEAMKKIKSRYKL